MNPFIDILLYIVETLGSLFLSLVILRFLLQWVRADFYNPVSQGIVKITNPLLIPLRRLIPSALGIDLASIVLVLLIQLLLGEIIALIVAQTFVMPTTLIVYGIVGSLKLTTYIYFICIVILVVSSFVAPFSSNPILMLVRQLIDPLTRPIQRVIPPVGGLDFSVFFIGMGLVIVQKLLDATAYTIKLNPLLVVGY